MQRAHTIFLFPEQTDARRTVWKMRDNTIPWMTATSLQVLTKYLNISFFGGETGHGLEIIGVTLWKYLLCCLALFECDARD